VMMGGISLGPVLAGILLEHFWWGSVFLINLPAMTLLLVLAPVLLPEFKNPSRHGFDLVSSALSLGAVLPVIYGIKRAATDGFGLTAAVCIAAGLLVGAAFFARQRRAQDAMIDLGLFRDRRFGGSLLADTTAMFALVGNAVFMTQYLQLTLGMAPLRAAVWSLIPSVAVAGAAPLATVLGQRYPRGNVMTGGFVVGAGGFAVLTQLRTNSPLAVVIVGAGVLAFGLVIVLTLVTELVMATVTPQRAGAASALVETTSEFGGAMGIAVLGSISAAVYARRLQGPLPSGLSDGQAHSAQRSLSGAVSTSAQLPDPLAGRLLTLARHAATDGLNLSVGIGAAILLAAAAATFVLLRETGSGSAATADETF
jgi:MFS transporter, DHA2 family, multidrug resistance protein